MADHSHASGDHASAGHGHGSADHGHGGVGKYLAVFVGLCVLTAMSFALGNWTSVKESSPQVVWAGMMAVSCGKAMLVMLFFMHLIWEANWKYVLTIPASIMSLFLILMLCPDVGNRTELYSEERWLHSATPAETSGEPAEHLEHPDNAKDVHPQ